MSKYSIEIAGSNNEQQLFSPAGCIVRGRWHVSNVSSREQSIAMRALNKVVEIPGQIITLDVRNRTGEITDPLLTKEGALKFKEMNKIFEEFQEAHGGKKSLEENKIFKDLTIDEMKTWLHHMRQIIDNNMGEKVSGSHDLPSLDKIAKMPGKRTRDPGNTGQKDKDLKGQEFVDEVAVSK